MIADGALGVQVKLGGLASVSAVNIQGRVRECVSACGRWWGAAITEQSSAAVDEHSAGRERCKQAQRDSVPCSLQPARLLEPHSAVQPGSAGPAWPVLVATLSARNGRPAGPLALQQQLARDHCANQRRSSQSSSPQKGPRRPGERQPRSPGTDYPYYLTTLACPPAPLPLNSISRRPSPVARSKSQSHFPPFLKPSAALPAIPRRPSALPRCCCCASLLTARPCLHIY